jgi:hypothetical protein
LTIAAAVSCSLIAVNHDVGEEDGDDPTVGVIDLFRAGTDQPGDDARIDELAEGVLDPLLGLQLHDHRVECRCQLADLVAAADRHEPRELALSHRLGGFDQPPQCPDYRGRDTDPDAEPEQGGNGKQYEAHIFDRRLPAVDRSRRRIGQLDDCPPHRCGIWAKRFLIGAEAK